MNNYTFMQYFYRLAELSMSRFEWVNLPPSCDARYLEMALFTDSCAVFFEDDVVGYLTLSVLPQSSLSVYGNPMHRRAYSKYNPYEVELNSSNSVLVWNNLMRTNSFLDLQMFSKRLYNIDRVIDINVNAQKTPILLQGSENQQLTLRNVYQKYDGNQPVIFADKDFDLNALKVLNTNAPFVSGQLQQLKTDIWNECLTYLGICNVNILKKERMLKDEVARAQAGAYAARYAFLEARQKACEDINSMFGLDVGVRFRDEIDDIIDMDIMGGGDT